MTTTTLSRRETLEALLERVRNASRPDREMDAELFVAINGWKLAKVPPDAFGENACEIYTPDGKLFGGGFQYPPKGKLSPFYHVSNEPYTASIDAALGLVRRVFPGTMRCVGSMEDGPFCRLVVPDGRGGYINGERFATARTEPLAAVAALLTALIAQETKR